MTRALSTLALLLVASAASAQEAALPGQLTALRGGRVIARPGAEPQPATVLIDGARIVAVGELELPAGARVIDVEGLIITAGFIDAFTTLGYGDAKPAEEERGAREGSPEDMEAGPPLRMPPARRKGLRPSFDCALGYAPDDKDLGALRKAGFTAAQARPRWGYLCGDGALVQLRGGPRREQVLAPGLAQGGLYSGGGKGYPATPMGLMAHLRQFFADARRHRELKRLHAEGQGPRPVYDPDLERAIALLEGAPLLAYAESRRDLDMVLAIAQEQGLKLILAGAEEGFEVKGTLAERGLTVVGGLSWGEAPKRPKWAREDGKEGDKEGDKEEGGPALKGPFESERVGADGDEAKDEVKDEVDVEALLDGLEFDERVFVVERARWEARRRNLVSLHEAGVRLAFTSFGAKSPRVMLERLSELVELGLPGEVALAGLTTVPAELLGLADQLGTVEAGKLANLTILSDVVGAKELSVRYVVIDGELYEQDKGGAKPKAEPQPKAASLAGRWRFRIEGQPLEGTLELEQRGDDLSGRLETPFGVAELSGTASGDAFSFEAVAEIGGEKVTITARGKREGDKLSGTLSSPMGEDMSWAAERLPEGGRVEHGFEGPLHGDGCGCDEVDDWERSRR